MTDSDAISAERKRTRENLRRFYAVYPSGDTSDREREPDEEREPHTYKGYADGSACYICGNKRGHVLHKVKRAPAKTLRKS
jgi:hypothetical protein